MRRLPSGTVTFLFSDIEGSTKLLEQLGPARYSEALADHRRKLREAFASHDGVEVDTQGDAFFVAFSTASGALAAARDAQAALASGPIRVRMGIHSGEPLLTDEGYVGIDVHRGARVMSAGHGGQVLVSQATQALVASSFALRDLGRYRLKDLTEPQSLYQLGEGHFPPPKTLSQTNLPVQPTPLVGREQELSEVLRMLALSRLVTLTGAGGSGKTRLALQAAAEVVEDYPHGVWWVSLAALRDPELVEPTIAQAVGAKDGLRVFLRDKRALLLLDNFEQVIEAATMIAELLAAAPDLRMLVTSRVRLALAGEHEYPVPTLPSAEGAALFTARARQLRPGFEPDEHVQSICRRLDGLPLAIELAAARVKVLRPEQILGRLGHSLDLLTAGGRDAAARHRTLRATIDWSHDLLEPLEKRLFAHLGVFAGSFELEAAEAVCDADLETVAALVDKSLLRQTEEGRFFMLETIRDYALERLEASSEGDRLRRGHAEHFAQMLADVFEHLRRPGQDRWLDLIGDDHENVRAAIDWADEAGDTSLLLALVSRMYVFWYVRGHLGEGFRRLEHALSRAEGERSRTKGLAFLGAATIAGSTANFDRAVPWAEEAVDLLAELGEQRDAVLALTTLAALLVDTDDLGRARSLLDEARGATQGEDDYALLGVLANLCNLALRQHDYGRAAELGRQSAEVAARMGLMHALAITRSNTGIAELGLGNVSEAESLFVEALGFAHDLGNAEVEGWALTGLAAVSARNGKDEQAAALLGLAEIAMAAGGAVLEPAEQELFDETRSQAERALGTDGLELAMRHGRELEIGDVVAMVAAG